MLQYFIRRWQNSRIMVENLFLQSLSTSIYSRSATRYGGRDLQNVLSLNLPPQNIKRLACISHHNFIARTVAKFTLRSQYTPYRLHQYATNHPRHLFLFAVRSVSPSMPQLNHRPS